LQKVITPKTAEEKKKKKKGVEDDPFSGCFRRSG